MLDLLQTAEAVRDQVDPAIPPIDVAVVGARRNITAGSGVMLRAAASLDELAGFDTIVVGALGAMNTDQTVAALGTRDVRAVVDALRARRHGTARLAAACTGAFAVAEAGILDGGRATTSWWLGPAFRARYPAVDLDLGAMIVRDPRAITAGAAFAHVDLGLRLVGMASPRLAELVGRLLVIDDRSGQSAYIALDHLEHADPLVLAFERYARAHLGEPIDMASAAGAIGTSRRTLERRVGGVLGLSPNQLVQRLRVERALHLLRTTDEGVDQIASRVGYANGSTLRALLRRANPPRAAAAWPRVAR